MLYKLYLEDGDYVSLEDGQPRNLLDCLVCYSDEGINVGWTEFETLEEAMEHFKIKLKEM